MKKKKKNRRGFLVSIRPSRKMVNFVSALDILQSVDSFTAFAYSRRILLVGSSDTKGKCPGYTGIL